jgi:integrase
VQKDKYFIIRYSVNGKRYQEGLGWASDKWTAERASGELAKLKNAHRTGKGAYTMAELREQENARREEEKERKKQEEKDSLTLARFWDESYFPYAKLYKTAQTIKTEKSYYNLWIKPKIGEKTFKDITPLDLERIKKNMADAGRSPKTIAHSLAIVRQIINRAQLLGYYKGDNPTHKVKKPKTDNKRIRFLSYVETETLLDKLSTRSPDVHDMALLALHCGPRAGEIFGLTWQDIDFERGLVTLRHTKNGHVRHVPMTVRVREMLKNRESVRDSELVFPARNGSKRKEVSNSFERAVKDLGWNKGIEDPRQKVVFHSLRHTCASWLVMAGVPLYTVKEYLGHRQISQTERYAHLAPDSLQQATAAMNGIQSRTDDEKVLDFQESNATP